MRIPTAQTVERRAAKAAWFTSHPAAFDWLVNNTDTPLRKLVTMSQCRVMVAELKADGLYSQSTVVVDIAAAMRRIALTIQRNTP